MAYKYANSSASQGIPFPHNLRTNNNNNNNMTSPVFFLSMSLIFGQQRLPECAPGQLPKLDGDGNLPCKIQRSNQLLQNLGFDRLPTEIDEFYGWSYLTLPCAGDDQQAVVEWNGQQEKHQDGNVISKVIPHVSASFIFRLLLIHSNLLKK